MFLLDLLHLLCEVWWLQPEMISGMYFETLKNEVERRQERNMLREELRSEEKKKERWW